GAGGTGGRPDLLDTLSRAGVDVGVDGIFIETHQNPSVAKSDGANMLPLAQLPALLDRLSALRAVINNF
ncbi:MAG: 3-deoxy-8-phosphooctulonate synthase, partial [Duncaniella sp.]|nr:3-deoxy-8-phosphooctulonate synthase [Duncaniella sp.]